MLRYAITDRRMFAGDERDRRDALVTQARRLAEEGVDFLQLREKDLPYRDLLQLGRALTAALQLAGESGAAHRRTTLLVNAGGVVPWTGDAAAESACLRALLLRSGAGGLHLPGGWSRAHLLALRDTKTLTGSGRPLLSVTAHTVRECEHAAASGADLIVFGPVFEKQLPAPAPPLRGTGLDRLADAAKAAAPIPLLALGGVTPENAAACIRAGAAGIAGIRLFLTGSPFSHTPDT